MHTSIKCTQKEKKMRSYDPEFKDYPEFLTSKDIMKLFQYSSVCSANKMMDRIGCINTSLGQKNKRRVCSKKDVQTFLNQYFYRYEPEPIRVRKYDKKRKKN